MDNKGPDKKLMKRTRFFRKYIFNRVLVFCLLIFFLNLLLRKFADPDDAYAKALNYNQLYVDKGKVHISSISLAKDFIYISFDGNALQGHINQFQLLLDKKLISQMETDGVDMSLKLPEAGSGHFGVVINRDPDTIYLNIELNSKTNLNGQIDQERNRYEITGNTLISPVHLYPYSYWAIRNWGGDTAGSGVSMPKILSDSVHIHANEKSTDKILKISRYILQKTAGHEGNPNEELSVLNPLTQLRFVEAGRSKLWCGNFSSIFSYFAAAAGMPVRWVSCGKSNGNFVNGIHVFCEVFLKEEQCWAYVDLTSRNVLTRYHEKWLNAVDVQRLLRYQIKDSSLVAWHFERDSLYQTAFSNVDELPRKYFHADNRFVYYFADYLSIMYPKNISARFTKFFYIGHYYATYSDNSIPTSLYFYLRLITNYLLLVLSLVYGLQIFKGLFSHQVLASKSAID
jgi:hypothetical protein